MFWCKYFLESGVLVSAVFQDYEGINMRQRNIPAEFTFVSCSGHTYRSDLVILVGCSLHFETAKCEYMCGLLPSYLEN